MLTLSLLGATFSSICLGKHFPQYRTGPGDLKVIGSGGHCPLLRLRRAGSSELWLISYFILQAPIVVTAKG